MITIDYREKKLITKLKDVNFKIENLPIGDILISLEDSENKIYKQFVIERKTQSDMLSSISDGRYKNQKSRMLDYRKDNDGSIILIYLIEKGRSKFALREKNLLRGIYTSLVAKYHIYLLFSENITDTAKYIKMLAKKISEESEEKNIIIGGKKNIKNTMKRRGATINKKNFDYSVLNLIPTIGEKKATLLIEEFGNINKIKKALEEDIQCQSINKKNIENLKKYLF